MAINGVGHNYDYLGTTTNYIRGKVSDGTLWEAQTALCFRCKHLSDCAVPVLAADSSRDGRRLS